MKIKQLFFDNWVLNEKVIYLKDLLSDCKDKKVEIDLECIYDKILEEIEKDLYSNRRYI